MNSGVINVSKKSQTIQNDINSPENCTGSTNSGQNDRQAMMLKMVSSCISPTPKTRAASINGKLSRHL